MSEFRHTSAGPGYSVAADGGVTYVFIAGTNSPHSTEAHAQLKAVDAYTAKEGSASILTNTCTTASTIRVRDDGVDANPLISCTASTTGLFEDVVNTSAIAAGSLLCWVIDGGGTKMSEVLAWTNLGLTLEHATLHSSIWACGSSAASQSNNVTRYYPITGDPADLDATESNVHLPLRAAATLSNLRIYTNSNTITATSTARVRKNGGNGNGVVSITASTTGAFEDVTNSDSIASGDTIDYALTTGATGSNLDAESIGVKAICPIRPQIRTRTSSGQTADSFDAIEGHSASVTTESQIQIPARTTRIAQALYVLVSANVHNSNTVIALRVNAASSALTVSVPASTTGVFEDNTHSVTLAETDALDTYIDLQGTGSITVRNISISHGESAAGPQTLTPSPVVVPVAVATPAVTKTLTISPSPVTVPIALATPAVSRVLTLTPTPVIVPIALPAPTRAFSIAPSPVTVPVAITTPAVSATLTISPSPVVVPIATVAPSITATLTVSPSPVVVPLSVATPSVNILQTLTPSPVIAPLAVPQPSVVSTLTISPSPVSVPISIATPAVTASYTLSPSPVTVPLAIATPSVTVGVLTLTPSPVVVPLSVVAPTVTSILTISPNAVTVPINLTTPTITFGAITISPSPIIVPVSVVTPSITAVLTISPSPVIVPVVTQAPSITSVLTITPTPIVVPIVAANSTLVFGNDIAPTPVVVPLVIATPAVAFGAITITPSTVTVPITIATPTVAATLTVSPSPVNVPISISTPAVSYVLTLTPNPVVVPISIVAPSIALTLIPSPVLVPISLTTPSVTTAGTITPSPVTVPISLPSSNISLSLTLTPSPVVVPLSITAPSITTALVISPGAVVVPIVIPAPTVTQIGVTVLTPSPIIIPVVLTTATITITVVPPVVPPVVVVGGGGWRPPAQRIARLAWQRLPFTPRRLPRILEDVQPARVTANARATIVISGTVTGYSIGHATAKTIMQILIRAKGYNVQRAKVEANIVYDAKAYVGGGTVIAKALAEPTLWYDTSEIEQALEEAWLLDLPLDLVLDSLHNNKQVAVLDKNARER